MNQTRRGQTLVRGSTLLAAAVWLLGPGGRALRAANEPPLPGQPPSSTTPQTFEKRDQLFDDHRGLRLALRERGVDYGEIVRRANLPSVYADGEGKPGEERKQFSFYSFGAIFAQVRVDEASGSIRLARLCGVYDAGRLMNSKTAHSQIIGGMAMGAGATH